MGDFTKVSADAFNEIQKEAGLILSTFDPTGATAIQDSHILFTTTGGITINYKPTIGDYGEDIDNVPNGTAELAYIEDDEASMAFTAVNVTPESVKASVGAADITTETGTSSGTLKKVTPRKTLTSSDFKEFWWVGDMANGGFAACKITKGLSTEGFGLKTTKKGKGNVDVTITAFNSISAISAPKMEFYIYTPAS